MGYNMGSNLPTSQIRNSEIRNSSTGNEQLFRSSGIRNSSLPQTNLSCTFLNKSQMMYNYFHQKKNTVGYFTLPSGTIQLVILKDNSAQPLKKRELKINKKWPCLKENAQQKTYLVF